MRLKYVMYAGLNLYPLDAMNQRRNTVRKHVVVRQI